MAIKKTKTKKPAINRNLDEIYDHLLSNGPMTVRKLIAGVYHDEEPASDRMKNALDLMEEDQRFAVARNKDLAASEVRILGNDEAKAPAQEPEELKPDPAAVDAKPVDTTPTIGELVEQTKKAEAAKPDAAPATPPANSEDHNRLEAIQNAKEYRDDCERDFERSKKQTASYKKKLKEAEANLLEVINGQQSLLAKSGQVRRDSGQPAQVETGRKPQDAAAPAAAPAPGVGDSAFDPRAIGAKDAIAGKTELDCPYNAKKQPSETARWFDGWREQMRAEPGERLAIKQGMTKPKLQAALLPRNGILKPGEATPVVKAVMVDHRNHLVLDMLSAEEGPVKGVERWHLQPLFDKGEWKDIHQETYGPAVAGVDKNDERKADRQKGGVDCGRTVKVGKSTFVVGPRQLLTVMTTGEATASAAKAS